MPLREKIYEATYWIWPDSSPPEGTYEAVARVVEALIRNEILREV